MRRLPKPEPARATLASHLNGADGFVLSRDATATGRDDAVQNVVVELEELAVVDGRADDGVYVVGTSADALQLLVVTLATGESPSVPLQPTTMSAVKKPPQ